MEDSGDLRSIRGPSVSSGLQTRSPKDLKNAVQGLLCGEHINRLLFGARSSLMVLLGCWGDSVNLFITATSAEMTVC